MAHLVTSSPTRVLVLGASGFIGSWAVRALIARGAETHVLCRPSSDLWRLAGVEPFETHAHPESEWTSVIERVRPDVVLSLDWAGVAGANRDDAEQFANLQRHDDVVKAAASAGARRFVGVGSQAEYGPKNEVIVETASTEPRTAYGRAKLAAMAATRARCAELGIEWAWARVFSTYGALDNGHWLLPLIADALITGTDIDLTTGEQRWSYLNGADAGAAMAAIALADDASGIYNVGDPDAPRLRDTIERFATHFDSAASLNFGARSMGDDPVVWLQPDVTRLRSLGWERSVALDQGLAEAATWFSGGTVPDSFGEQRWLPTRP